MKSISPLFDQLVRELRRLPGVGQRTATRMAFHLLERDRDGGRSLAQSLLLAMDGIGRCGECRILSEYQRCAICSNPGRDRRQLCILETPADLFAIEASGLFRGVYFVLTGHLSPLDGIGPEALGLDRLQQRLQQEPVDEVILATGTTVEGEATAHYLAELVRPYCRQATRIAHGVPVGGDLELVDAGTLAHALSGRRILL